MSFLLTFFLYVQYVLIFLVAKFYSLILLMDDEAWHLCCGLLMAILYYCLLCQ